MENTWLGFLAEPLAIAENPNRRLKCKPKTALRNNRYRSQVRRSSVLDSYPCHMSLIFVGRGSDMGTSAPCFFEKQLISSKRQEESNISGYRVWLPTHTHEGCFFLPKTMVTICNTLVQTRRAEKTSCRSKPFCTQRPANAKRLAGIRSGGCVQPGFLVHSLWARQIPQIRNLVFGANQVVYIEQFFQPHLQRNSEKAKSPSLSTTSSSTGGPESPNHTMWANQDDVWFPQKQWRTCCPHIWYQKA